MRYSKNSKSSIFGQFLPILATFYEVKITFLKKLVGGAQVTNLMFYDSTCSGVSKISNLFCAHFWVNKSLSMMCVTNLKVVVLDLKNCLVFVERVCFSIQ
jgi:hypothetical protein